MLEYGRYINMFSELKVVAIIQFKKESSLKLHVRGIQTSDSQVAALAQDTLIQSLNIPQKGYRHDSSSHFSNLYEPIHKLLPFFPNNSMLILS